MICTTPEASDTITDFVTVSIIVIDCAEETVVDRARFLSWRNLPPIDIFVFAFFARISARN